MAVFSNNSLCANISKQLSYMSGSHLSAFPTLTTFSSIGFPNSSIKLVVSFLTQSLMTVFECPQHKITPYLFYYYKTTLIIPNDVNVLPVPGGPLISVIGLL